MRYVKILSLVTLFLATPLLFVIRAQDLDNVTAAEDVQIEAAGAGDLGAAGKSTNAASVSDASAETDAGKSSVDSVPSSAADHAAVTEAEVSDLADKSLVDGGTNATASAESATPVSGDGTAAAASSKVTTDEAPAAATDSTSEATSTETTSVTDGAKTADVSDKAASSDVVDSGSTPVESAVTSEATATTSSTEDGSVAKPSSDGATVSAAAESAETSGAGISETAVIGSTETAPASESPSASGTSTESAAVTEKASDAATSGSTKTTEVSAGAEASSAEAPVAETTETSTGAVDSMVDKALSAPPATEADSKAVSGGADAAESSVAPVAASVQKAQVAESVIPAPQEAHKKFTNQELVQQEANRRKALEIHAQETLKLADRAYASKDYIRAGKLYEEAVKYMGDRAAVRMEKARAETLSGKANYRAALLLRKQGKLEDAEKVAQIAASRNYKPAVQLLNDIRKERNLGPSVKKEEAAPVEAAKPVWDRKEYKAERKTVDDLLKEGKQYMAVGDLNAASDRFELILKQDPYNAEAIRLLEKTAVKKYDRATAELDATRRNMIVDVRKTWNPRDYAAGVSSSGPRPGEGGGTTKPPSDGNSEIETRMKQIIIPEIDFRQFNINDVVTFFQEASIPKDATPGDAQSAGINFILRLGGGATTAGGAGAQGGDAGGFGGAESNSTDAIDAQDVPLVTFKAHQISLYKALKIVTDSSELKFTIQDDVVVILRKNDTTLPMMTRLYDVLPTISQKVRDTKASVAGGAEPAGGGAAAGGGGDLTGTDIPTSDAPDYKEFFANMGVQWPNGSTISYVPAIGRMVVRNTEENLVEFENILKIFNVTPSQIEIEARFVEVNQTDANELGFEWMLNDTLTKSSSSLLGSGQAIQAQADTTGLRFMQDLSVNAPADDIVTVASVLSNPELQFVIHALQQKGNADLLSAPKVTTQSGVAARISVVTEYVYPTEFTVTPITGRDANGGTTIVGGVVEPSTFMTREVGVVLDVTPEVAADGKMISLTMSPKVVTEPTWKNYGSTYTAPDGSTQQLTMEQPFFHTRSVDTQVSIYNGATVVMGGMINESRTEVDDKIPFLGDIPIIGRLFQSKYESTDKRNLLIFVTARLVDPAGKPMVRPDDEKLMPHAHSGDEAAL